MIFFIYFTMGSNLEYIFMYEPGQAGEPELAPQAAPPHQPRPAQGPNEGFLAELKAMGAGPSPYPRGQANSRDKQVDRPARLSIPC